MRELDAATIDDMWTVFAAHYDGARRDTFERDLAGKSDVILARDAGDHSLQGFSTIVTSRHEHLGRPFVAIFSGDTIVAPAYWGQRALQNAFGSYITRTKLRNLATPTYWFLISKGYKTYLLFSRNFPHHWPRPGSGTPEWERGAIDALARARFGDAWDADKGIVRASDKDRLRADVAPLDEEALSHEDVRFFVQANPGWEQGDELACLARVDLAVWGRYLAKQARHRARAVRRRSWSPS